MPEWRKDPLMDRWVVIATGRSKRPSDFIVPEEEKKDSRCPLCVHHEGETPPEIMAYREENSGRDRPGWWVRVVPNKFPAVKIEGGDSIKRQGLYQYMDGLGAHEVVVESPDHARPLEDLNQYQVAEVIRAWRDRSLDLRRDLRFKYIQVFKNYGGTAGASLGHPHSQVIAVPMVPGEVAKKMEILTGYACATGRCILCEMVESELSNQVRVVWEGGRFIAVAPFASRFPFETWIIPRDHQPDFGHIREDQVNDLAYVLRAALKKLSMSLGSPPYNMMINTAPVNSRDGNGHFHWHLEILPRLTVAAGFELGTGCFINPTPPELAAAELRETEMVYDREFNILSEGVCRHV